MTKFNITDLLNNRSKEESTKNTFKIRNINIDDITPDSRNFYDVSDIEELKESIEMFGLQQNLVVRENKDKYKYKLISGHRRLKALQILVEKGYEEFKQAPCKVETDTDEIKAELQLIFANSTSRELSDYEKTWQAVRIKELLTELKKSGMKITGRMRDIVADALNTSPTQIARMETINKNLSEDFKEQFREDKVNISTAYELSGLTEEEQGQAYEKYEGKGSLTIKDVKEIKKNKVNEKVENKYTNTKEDYKTHELKIISEDFKAIKEGKKTFEYRFNDRGYQVGDILKLKEYDKELNEYTGNSIEVEITYILEGTMHVMEGYAILSIKIIKPGK